MTQECDNKSVGVIITDTENNMALLTRGRFPIGVAPPAGHVDGHGSLEQTAIEETGEEVGIILTLEALKKTAIHNRRVNNRCRRPGGDYHEWTIYEARIEGQALSPDIDETNGASWYSQFAVQALADRTKAFRAVLISEQLWSTSPGLEPVWLDFLTELGYVQ